MAKESKENFESFLNFELADDGTYQVSAKKSLCPSKIVIPSEYKNIPVTRIKEEGFSYCLNLKEVVLPNSIKRLENLAFKRCENLEFVDMPDSVEYLGDLCFYFCLKLKNLHISKNLMHIGAYCFQRCELLGDVVLPEKLDYVGTYIFQSAQSTQLVTLKSIPQYFDELAFHSKYLKKVIFDVSEEYFEANKHLINFGPFKTNYFVKKNESLVELNKEDTMNTNSNIIYNNETLYAHCFTYSTVEKIILGPNVRKIESRAFSGCKYLKEIVFSDGLIKIGDAAFCNTLIEEIILPNSVKEIGTLAFQNMKSLRKVVFPKELNYFTNWFANNNPDISIVWPEKYLKDTIDADFSAYPFETIVIPEGIVHIKHLIGDDFRDWNANILKCIEFPKSLLSIDQMAIRGCNSLEKVIFKNDSIIVPTHSFYDCPNLKIDEKHLKPLRVKCLDKEFGVNKIYSFDNKDELKEKFQKRYYEYGEYFDVLNPGDCHSFEDFLESLTRQKKTRLYKRIINDKTKQGMEKFDGSIPVSLESHLCFSQAMETTSNKDFFRKECVGLLYDRKQFEFAIIKVNNIEAKHLREDFEYDNEDTFMTVYLKDGDSYYLLIVATYDW